MTAALGNSSCDYCYIVKLSTVQKQGLIIRADMTNTAFQIRNSKINLPLSNNSTDTME